MTTSKVDRHEFKEVSETELEKDILNYPFLKLDLSFFHTYLFKVLFEDGSFTLDSIEMAEGISSGDISIQNSEYKGKVFSSGQEVLYDFNVGIPRTFVIEPPSDWFDENGDQIFIPEDIPSETLSDVNFVIRSPYFLDGIRVDIVDENEVVVLSIDISDYKGKINSVLGYGGGSSSGQDKNITYSILSQPTAVLNSASYSMELGWSVYYEE